jgi:hypothetical protein
VNRLDGQHQVIQESLGVQPAPNGCSVRAAALGARCLAVLVVPGFEYFSTAPTSMPSRRWSWRASSRPRCWAEPAKVAAEEQTQQGALGGADGVR